MADRRIWDVSRPIGESTAVFPGDTTFSRRWVMRLEDGCSCNVSTITTTVHVATHADAPLHFVKDGLPIDRVDLGPYLGPCRVISAQRADALRPEDLAGLDLRREERILVRAPQALRHDEWRTDFLHCSIDAAHALVQGGARLLGLDTPSMDHSTSKELAAHKVLAAGGVALLESLDLSAVPDGRYELIALPLRIAGSDASPVRAVLRSL